MRGSLISFFVLAASLTAVFAAPAPQGLGLGDLDLGDLGLGSLTSDVNGIVAGAESDPNVVPGRTSMLLRYRATLIRWSAPEDANGADAVGSSGSDNNGDDDDDDDNDDDDENPVLGGVTIPFINGNGLIDGGGLGGLVDGLGDENGTPGQPGSATPGEPGSVRGN